MLNVILKKDAFTVSTNSDSIIIRKFITEERELQYSSVETKAPQFNQLRSNLERSTSRPKDSEEKKKSNPQTPNAPSSGGSKPSGGPRKSWVLASSDPQTKPFEENRSPVEDPDEKPKTVNPKPEQENKIYSVKDNPYVRGITPNKTVKSTITESRIYKPTERLSQISKRPSVTGSSKTPEIRKSQTTVTNTSKPITSQSSKIDTGKTVDRSKSKPKEASKRLKGSVADGWHSLEYENGMYEGDVKNNKRNGKGKYTWQDGNWYEGDWVDDQKEGMGKFSWTTGDVYEGEYKGDKRHGVGSKTYSNGDKYEVLLWLL